MPTYQKALDTICVIDTGVTRALTHASPRSFAATDTGSTTTIVSSTGATARGASGDDDFVGYIVECTDGAAANIGCRRRVCAYDNTTGGGTLTIDKLPSATASGDTFNLYDPPHIWFAEDTGGSDQTILDATRTEGADIWLGSAAEGGPYVEVIAADNAATSDFPLISDSSTGFLSTGTALTGNTAIGDSYEVWQCPEVMNGALMDCTQEMIERNPPTGDYGRPASRAGNRSAAGTMQLAFRGPGTGREGSYAEAHRWMKCIFDYSAGAGNLTVHSGGSTSSVPYDAGTAVLGDMYATAEGSAFCCTAVGTPATPSPNLATAPAEDSTCYELATYTPSTGLNEAMAVKQYRGDGILEYIWGVVPAITFSGTRGGFLTIDCALQGADWMRLVYDSGGTAVSRGWDPVRSTINPVKLADMRCVVDGTALGLRSFTFDPAFDVQPKVNLTAPNETDGFEIVNDNPNGTLEVYVDSNTIETLEDFLSGKEVIILLQANSAAGFPGVFAIWARNCRYTGPALGDDAGQMTISLPFQVVRHTTTGLSRYAIGIG